MKLIRLRFTTAATTADCGVHLKYDSRTSQLAAERTARQRRRLATRSTLSYRYAIEASYALTRTHMRVVFLSTKLCKSTVVDAASGTLLFELATPGFRKRKTTMYDHQGNTIGIYHRHFWRSDKVCFRGQTRRLSEWMPKKRWSRCVLPSHPVHTHCG